jgi:uncharacterized protein (DUF983 family)
MRCGACGSRGLIRRWFEVTDRCPRCGLRFERIDGHSTAAIGLNTIVTFTLLFFFIVIGSALFIPDIPVRPLIIGGLAVAIGFPLLFHPFSYTVWLAIDLLLRPPRTDEFDVSAPGVHLMPADH